MDMEDLDPRGRVASWGSVVKGTLMDGWLAMEVKVLREIYCPANHQLKEFVTPRSGYLCNLCEASFPVSTKMHGCRSCEFDLCGKCISSSQAHISSQAKPLGGLAEHQRAFHRFEGATGRLVGTNASSSPAERSRPGTRELFHRFHAGQRVSSEAAPATGGYPDDALPEHHRAFHQVGKRLGTSKAMSTAFVGEGIALGASTSCVDAAPVQSDSASVVVDHEKPRTKLQLRFPDNSRKVQEFNEDHTVGDLRAFCKCCLGGHDLTLLGGFPLKPLTDDVLSLQDAGLLASVITVRLC